MNSHRKVHSHQRVPTRCPEDLSSPTKGLACHSQRDVARDTMGEISEASHNPADISER